MTINCKGKLLDLSKPVIAGILNVTPDSFYDGGAYTEIEKIKIRANQILSEGATIIDIGAFSSRPGTKHISEKEELNRLRPVLEMLQKDLPETILSVDTFRSEVAKIAIKDYGVSIINDISAGNLDKKMLTVVSELNVPYIIMHMNGTPKNMQDNPQYKDIVRDILMFFSEKIMIAKQIGIHDVIIDPGFGFGKTLEHNYQLLKGLEKLKITDCPILVGISRKSMIYNLLETKPNDVLPGSLALNMVALEKGASILRVHDVKETVQIVKVFNQLNSV